MAQTHAIFAGAQHKQREGKGVVEDKQTPANMATLGTTYSDEGSSGSVGLVNECVLECLIYCTNYMLIYSS